MEYVINESNKFNDKQLTYFYEKLPTYKKDKIKKYKSYKAKINSIIGEIGLEDLLLRHNISYHDLKFYTNYYGKPYIGNNNIYFSISHSYDYIVTAISKKEIGVDIERIRNTSLNVINKIATEKEKEYILMDKRKIIERIFTIYTLKEAYFKMEGKDLKDILNVEFKIQNDKVYCNDKNVKAGLIKEINGYIIAYCEKGK